MSHHYLIIFSLLALFSLSAASGSAKAAEPCVGCDKVAPPNHRGEIKAARAKVDAEMRAETKRPWDGTSPGRKSLADTFKSSEPVVPRL